MKYKILQLDEHGRISFTKEELEKLLDEVYEEGRRDGHWYPYWYGSTITTTAPITYGTGTGDKNTWDKWTITIGDSNTDHTSTSSMNTVKSTYTSVTGANNTYTTTATPGCTTGVPQDLLETYQQLDKIKYGLKD